MAFLTVIDTASLADRLGDPSVAIVDCRYDLANHEWGLHAYRERHIPGAVYAHLARDLAGEKTGINGRHPLPPQAVLERTLGRLGIAREHQVVAYDQTDGSFASRLWWMLRWLGHDAVAVLDGGFAKWLDENRPTVMGDESRPAARFSGSSHSSMAVAAADLHDAPSDRWRLVDARSPERYRGDHEPLDRIGGHIPGALNRHYKTNLDPTGTFKPRDELRREFDALLGGAPIDHVVCYCGSGVTACHNLLALEHAGLAGAKLYPGSWSEWASNEARPIETGERSSGRKS